MVTVAAGGLLIGMPAEPASAAKAARAPWDGLFSHLEPRTRAKPRHATVPLPKPRPAEAPSADREDTDTDQASPEQDKAKAKDKDKGKDGAREQAAPAAKPAPQPSACGQVTGKARAVLLITPSTAAGALGDTLCISAATPATCGAAIEVPLYEA